MPIFLRFNNHVKCLTQSLQVVRNMQNTIKTRDSLCAELGLPVHIQTLDASNVQSIHGKSVSRRSKKNNERNNIKSWLGSRNSKLEKAIILNMTFFPTLIIYVDNDNVLTLTKI